MFNLHKFIHFSSFACCRVLRSNLNQLDFSSNLVLLAADRKIGKQGELKIEKSTQIKDSLSAADEITNAFAVDVVVITPFLCFNGSFFLCNATKIDVEWFGLYFG